MKYKKDYTFFVKIITLVLIVYTISLIFPFIWGVITSFKGPIDFIENPLGLPKTWEFNNYLTAYNYFFVPVESMGQDKFVYIEQMLLNSLIYAVGGSFISTFVTCIVAYVAARFDYKFSKVIYWVVVITMILPIVGSMASEKQIVIDLGLFDSIFGVYILKANFLGLYFLVFYAAFKGIPKDYDEAAVIDGASNSQVFFKIIFPMVFKLFTTVMLIKFIELWNDYQTPLIYLPSHPTIAVGLFAYSRSYIGEISTTPMKLAGAIMIFIPIFIAFIFLQKKLIGGVSMGGVKE